MLPGIELMGCADLAVPAEVMHHVVRVESSYNPFAIGVVGGRLARQPRSLEEALSTSRMLEREGYNFSLGLAQVNRHNFKHYGLDSHEKAFDICPNLRAGAQILSECHTRAGGDWGKAFSCYYSGNFVTGYQHGYVQKVFASWQAVAPAVSIAVVPGARIAADVTRPHGSMAQSSRIASRLREAARSDGAGVASRHADPGLTVSASAPDDPAAMRPADPVAPDAVQSAPAATSPRVADDTPVTVGLTSAPVRPAAGATPSPSRPLVPHGVPPDSAFVF